MITVSILRFGAIFAVTFLLFYLVLGLLLRRERWEGLKKSYQFIRKNPILLVPDLVLTVLSSLLLYLAYTYAGIRDVIATLQSAEKEIVAQVLRDYFAQNLINFVLAIVLLVFVTFFFGVGVDIIRYQLVQQAISNKKPSIGKAWKEKRSYFWNIVLLRILLFIVGLVAVAVVLLLGGLSYTLVGLFLNDRIAGIVAAIFTVLLGGALLLVLSFSFFFRYPIMFTKNVKSAYQVLKESYAFFRQQRSYVILTWLVLLCLGILSLLISTVFNKVFDQNILLLQSGWSSIGLLVLQEGLQKIFSIIISLWGTVFLFLRFKEQM